MNLRKTIALSLGACLFCLLINLSPALGSERPTPSFVIFAHGLWGSMDKLPSSDRSWLESSPYPHYKKHQETSYLTGPDYLPIPQRYLKLGEGEFLSKLVIHPYWLMRHEFDYWAKRVNQLTGEERIKIFDDWQILQEAPEKVESLTRTESAEETETAGSEMNIPDHSVSKEGEVLPGGAQDIGAVNLIYLKFDWRLELPGVIEHYLEPLVSFIDQRWPEAKLHLVGHSLGGLVGRYAVSCFPGRFTSLVTVGAPHYGLYEINLQRRGLKTTFGEQWDYETAQVLGLWFLERFFFETKIVRLGNQYTSTAVEFGERYTPMAKWLDPDEGLLADGFGSLPKLKETVPHALALYGLGYGSYDLDGVYHPEIISLKIGAGTVPGKSLPPAYAVTGDGRVDPVSARGPFSETLCLGKDQPHGTLMWSPLVLTALIDRYYFNGEMSPADLWRCLRRLDVSWDQKNQRIQWLQKARELWEKGKEE